MPQAAQAEPRPPPGTPAGAPGGGEGLSWYERTTSRESGRVSGGEGISLRSMPSGERVGSAAAAAESLSSSLLESVSSIIRVGVERWRLRSVSSDLALVPLLRLRLTVCSRSDGRDLTERFWFWFWFWVGETEKTDEMRPKADRIEGPVT